MTPLERAELIEEELLRVQREIDRRRPRRNEILRFNDLKRIDELRARKNRLWILLQETLSSGTTNQPSTV
ncbi:hypothetical protein [Hoeflea poritis]|uniref:DUF465 domain-containing protein n=1 Tax=Hoeflea poritis TaxID=2993659 RepID=A0ABT4VHW6_9HYPH|nr:hypothetical protein [Hoeflea poritis]MDA4844303.1 hypothetical protein [Hoeflea poritis]